MFDERGDLHGSAFELALAEVVAFVAPRRSDCEREQAGDVVAPGDADAEHLGQLAREIDVNHGARDHLPGDGDGGERKRDDDADAVRLAVATTAPVVAAPLRAPVTATFAQARRIAFRARVRRDIRDGTGLALRACLRERALHPPLHDVPQSTPGPRPARLDDVARAFEGARRGHERKLGRPHRGRRP